jgi:Leucine-rich repeat (LRR) protein
MEKLNRDELFSLAIHLDLPSLLKLCLANKRFSEKICTRNEIWNYRLLKDFPDYKSLNLENKISEKSIYQLLYGILEVKNELKRKETIYQLYSLQTLDLSNNKLAEISTSLGNLVNLRILRLPYNKLTEISASLGNLVNLQTLHLYNNYLTEISASLGNLVNLRTLSLYNNKLTEIPTSLGNLVNLHTLHLSSNKLTEIPASLGNLVNLQRLDLSNNKLAHQEKNRLKEKFGNTVQI